MITLSSIKEKIELDFEKIFFCKTDVENEKCENMMRLVIELIELQSKNIDASKYSDELSKRLVKTVSGDESKFPNLMKVLSLFDKSYLETNGDIFSKTLEYLDRKDKLKLRNVNPLLQLRVKRHLVKEINEMKTPLTTLPLSIDELTEFIKAYGKHIKYFKIKALDKSKVLELLSYCENLEQLHIHNTPLNTEQAIMMANSNNLRNLEQLSLFLSYIGKEGAKAIAASKNFRNLKRLVLRGNGMGDEGALAIFTSTELRNLRGIDLGQNNISEIGAQAIAERNVLTDLEELDIRNNRLGNNGAQAIVTSEKFRLKALVFDCCGIDIEGVRAIAASEKVGNLRHLSIEYNRLRDEAAEVIAETTNLTNLELLDLANNDITARGAQAIVTSKKTKQSEKA